MSLRDKNKKLRKKKKTVKDFKEQIDEISKSTLKSYIDKAVNSKERMHQNAKLYADRYAKQSATGEHPPRPHGGPDDYERSEKYADKAEKRGQSIKKAVDKLGEETINELSKDTLKSYKDKIQRDVGRAYAIHQDPWKKTSKDDMRKLRNRVKGDERADMRLKEESLDEISKKTLGSYVAKAEKEEDKYQQNYTKLRNTRDTTHGKFSDDTPHMADLDKKAAKRGSGVYLAKQKLAKEEVLDEAGKVYDPITKKMVARKPIKVQAGGGATRNGVPVETGPSKYKEKLKEALSPAKGKWHVYDTKSKDVHSTHATYTKAKNAMTKLNKEHPGYEKPGNMVADKFGMKAASYNEETEQIDEVSKSTLMRYVPSAARDVGSYTYKGKESGEWASHATRAGDWAAAERHSKDEKKSFDKAHKRIKGIDLATKKLGIQKEEVQVDEAIANPLPVQHAVSAVHKTLGPDSASRFLSHLKPGTEKHTTWDKVNDALVKQGVHTRHIARIAQHASHMNEELDEDHKHIPGTQVHASKAQVKATTHQQKMKTESRGHKVIANFLKNREVAQRAFTGQNKPAETPKEPEKKELKKEAVNPALMAILKKRQAAQSATKPIDIGIETPKKDADQKKKMMGIKEGFMTKSIEDDMKNLSSYEYLKKYGKHKHQHRKMFATKSSDLERVEEGFDDYHAIAKELVKRHGKNVDTGHIKDIEDERDSHRPLDKSEVMHHVNKILAKEDHMPTNERWVDYMGKSLTHAHELHKQHAAAEHPAEKADIKGKISKHNQRIIDAAKKLRREGY